MQAKVPRMIVLGEQLGRVSSLILNRSFSTWIQPGSKQRKISTKGYKKDQQVTRRKYDMENL